ncbi:carbohydrate ABC transporter permease [Cohnella thailandensis]|uniref:Sugar ABC transporter permease n=1 Tax=Cohnella thailandensis TaxID=557557 RepID=A0A841SWV8_9BACL|nr:sugar ABC transporter permease [Cohnella thailandensis]MBB6634615.1 sugar ABC transporter permease [Cohnella thailandensis]MBP1972829.1 raffinose/stachyose/melibiose transport system permease protein [Cohnella thailandensis]
MDKRLLTPPPFVYGGVGIMGSLIKNKPYLWFILPGFILYSIFIIYPIFSAAELSLFHSNGFGSKTFVGLENYRELFTNPELKRQFFNALKNNLILVVLNVGLLIPIQLYFAYVIYTRVKGYRFFQTMIFAPQFITTSVIVFLATLVFDQNIGIFNELLVKIGLGDHVRNWLGVPGYELVTLFLINAWAGVGFSMIYFVAAMKMLSDEVMEASYLDGAGYWRRFFLIIIPQIRASIVNIAVISYIAAMTTFDFSYLLGGTSGGIGNKMDVMTLFFYRITFGTNGAMGGSVSSNSVGMGTTIACVMFAIIFLVALLQLKLSYRKEDH